MIRLDFETRSTCDIKKSGAWKYAEDPTTDILCMAYAVDDGPVQLWTPGFPIPYILQLSLRTNGNLVEAHSAFFERSIWENICVKRFGWPAIKPHQWRCSAAKVAARALPRSLAGSAEALRVSFQKDLKGKAIMLRLCKPRRPTKDDPSLWEEDIMDLWRLWKYCKTDVETERVVSQAVKDLSPQELKIWQLDQTINARGVLIDREGCEAAIACIAEIEKRLTAEFQILTGNEVKTATQRNRLLEWLTDEGTSLTSLTKSDVVEILGKNEITPTVRRVLEIRQELSKTSTAKFQTMLNAASADGRVRDNLMYHGAATGRWTGRLVQMQNIPRGTVEVTENTFKALKAGLVNDMATISSCLRGMLIPAPGKEFIAADYSAIEARVLFWLAEEKGGLELYRRKEDLYVTMAKKIYPAQEITKTKRTVGKTTILGCGYGMGAAKFQNALLTNAAIAVTEEFAKAIIATYRQTFPAVPKLWYAQEAAAIAAIRAPGRQVPCGKVTWGFDKDRVLYCKLPSGRLLAYNDPQIKASDRWEGKMELSCMVSSQGQWMRETTYGGKLVENITQAVARDIMANAMLAVEENGMPIVLSVHDEIVTEVPEGVWDAQMLIKFMTSLPTWAYGCPIEAEVWRGKRYKK